MPSEAVNAIRNGESIRMNADGSWSKVTQDEEFAHNLKQAEADLRLARVQIGLALVGRYPRSDGGSARVPKDDLDANTLRELAESIEASEMVIQSIREDHLTKPAGQPPRSSER